MLISSAFKSAYAQDQVKARMEAVYNSILRRLNRDFGGKPHFPICKEIQESYYEQIPDSCSCLFVHWNEGN